MDHQVLLDHLKNSVASRMKQASIDDSHDTEPSYITCLSSANATPFKTPAVADTTDLRLALDKSSLADDAVLNASPHRIKSRRHRKAVRRTKSAMDDVHPRCLHSVCSDPREPQGQRRGQGAPSGVGSNKVRPRQYSLPEKTDYEPCQDIPSVFIASRRLRNPAVWHDTDNSSLSSYKETSPEVEYIPTKTELRFTRSEPRVRRRDPAGSEPRSRTVTPSVRSLDFLRSKFRSRSTDPDQIYSIKRPRSRSLVETAVRIPLQEERVAPSAPPKSHRSPAHSSHKSSPVDSSSSSSGDEETLRKARPSSVQPSRISYLDPADDRSDSDQTATDHTLRPHNADAAATKRSNRHKKLFRLSTLIKSSDGHDSTNGEQAAKATASQQSSTVGLDWLFSTDTDSASSGENRINSRL